MKTKMSEPKNSVSRVDHQPLVRQVFKSDRTEGHAPPQYAVHLKTLCTGCKEPMECAWPEMTTWGGKPCTAAEYMALTMQSECVGIYCDDCLEKMPDVELEDLHHE